MSTPHNPNDANSPDSSNQPWGEQSANSPEAHPWSQQQPDPAAGQQHWGSQDQQAAAPWGAAQQQAGGFAGQPSDPYAQPYAQQQNPQSGQQPGWNGPSQAQSILANDGKGFLSSLFDFSFTSFVTPKIIKIVYIIVTVFIALGLLFFLIGAIASRDALAILAALILGPIVSIIYLALVRMSLELYFAVIRLSEDVHERLPRQ